MGIFDRMGRVISSNVNSLLDKGEDPRKLLELNLDEMGEQLKRGQQDVISAVAEEKQLKKKVDELEAEAEKWDKRAELALKTGDEALAREALKQKKRVSGGARRRREGARRAARHRAQDEGRARAHGAEAERAEAPQGDARGARGAGQERRRGRSARRAGRDQRVRQLPARWKTKIEGKEAEASAMAEVEEALGKGKTEDDLEAKFRELEKQIGRRAGEGDGAGRRRRARGAEEANPRVSRL